MSTSAAEIAVEAPKVTSATARQADLAPTFRRLAEEMDAEAAALATATSVAPQPDQSINNEKGK